MLRKMIAFALVVVSLMATSTVAFSSEAKVGYVTATGLYVRKEPDTGSEALRCADYGDSLNIIKEEGDWYYVQYNEVVWGYVSKKYVSTTSTSSSSVDSEPLPAKVSDLGKAPASSKIGDRGNDVKKLQQALKIMGYFKGTCDGIFGEVTESAVKKFQKAHGLSQDGVAGKSTIRIMFGEDPADGGLSVSGNSKTTTTTAQTEILDWFEGGKEFIPKGAYFTIKDVRSKTEIKVRHLYGGNHLDAEPVNRDETAKLKKVYGGEWSWKRRPVLVLYNGRVIAASMNGMPHGNQTIYDNDFDGQFCIHFLGSMTHESSKVDPDHQACVSEASRASW